MQPAKTRITSSYSITPAMGLERVTPRPRCYSNRMLFPNPPCSYRLFWNEQFSIDTQFSKHTRGYSESERVNYNEIRQALHSLACDVLVILDCCYATNRDSLFGKGAPETSTHGGGKMASVHHFTFTRPFKSLLAKQYTRFSSAPATLEIRERPRATGLSPPDSVPPFGPWMDVQHQSRRYGVNWTMRHHRDGRGCLGATTSRHGRGRGCLAAAAVHGRSGQ